ncbi:MAG: hypothetical protein ABW321_11780 [Polyangiales bacterium]
MSACSGDDDAASPGPDAGGSVDAGNAGRSGASGSAGSGGRTGASGSGARPSDAKLGAACESDTDCSAGFVCDPEMTDSLTVTGVPGNAIERTLHPGGSCTPKRMAPFDQTGGTTCDPRQPRGTEGCGSDGVCVVEDVPVAANQPPYVGCRQACDPSATTSGCDRPGYTCSIVEYVCVEGCDDDTECRIAAVDSDNDGVADRNEYDAESTAICDPGTSRCVHPTGAQTSGQSCTLDDDCSFADSFCIPEAGRAAGQSFPGGFCTQRACEFDGFECSGDKSVCESLRPWFGASFTVPLCLERCTVGAEPAAQQLGAQGHGEGCRDGYRCHYNGGPGADAGVCVGGVYNDVKTSNVGSLCTTNADCYSPFGLGYCMIYALTETQDSPGICTIFDCGVPGVPSDLCGNGNECVLTLDGGDTSMCAHNCKRADECPAGFACTNDDGDPSTTKTCFPVCVADEDCRANERCDTTALSTQPDSPGLCVLQ